MTLGRRRRGDSTLWRIYVPSDLALKVELNIVDPRTGRPIYGFRSQLISILLREYMNRVEREGPEAVLAEYQTKVQEIVE